MRHKAGDVANGWTVGKKKYVIIKTLYFILKQSKTIEETNKGVRGIDMH